MLQKRNVTALKNKPLFKICMKYSALVGLLLTLSSAGLGASQGTAAQLKAGLRWLVNQVKDTPNKQLRLGRAASWELEEDDVVEVSCSDGVVSVSRDSGLTRSDLKRRTLMKTKELQRMHEAKKRYEKNLRRLESVNTKQDKGKQPEVQHSLIEENTRLKAKIGRLQTESTNNFWRGAWLGAGLVAVATFGIVWSVHAWNNR